MERSKTITVAEIARLVGGELTGDGATTVTGVASLEAAAGDAISFLGNPRFKEAAMKCPAGALIVAEALPVAIPQVIVPDPYAAFVQVMAWFQPEEKAAPGVHPSAVMAEGVELGEGVAVGPLAVLGQGARIGAHSAIGAGAVIGAGATVGADSVLHPRVTLYPGVTVGARVIIHAGAVIGADGFGYIMTEKGHVKKPQHGTVVIADDVEIGANCAIDRAMLDATVIGQGSKLDNLVHLAHGVRLGKHCLIMANVGIGGSTRLGDFCIVSGNSTLKDNITLGDRVQVVGHSAVLDDIPPGGKVWGAPALPFSLAKRVILRLRQLPELFKRVSELEKK